MTKEEFDAIEGHITKAIEDAGCDDFDWPIYIATRAGDRIWGNWDRMSDDIIMVHGRKGGRFVPIASIDWMRVAQQPTGSFYRRSVGGLSPKLDDVTT